MESEKIEVSDAFSSCESPMEIPASANMGCKYTHEDFSHILQTIAWIYHQKLKDMEEYRKTGLTVDLREQHKDSIEFIECVDEVLKQCGDLKGRLLWERFFSPAAAMGSVTAEVPPEFRWILLEAEQDFLKLANL